MQFQKSKEDNLIRPVREVHMPIFQHCSNNSIAVTQKFFDEFVEPLLFLHGVDFTECDWRED